MEKDIKKKKNLLTLMSEVYKMALVRALTLLGRLKYDVNKIFRRKQY